MTHDVYCDESRPDAIHSKSPNGSRLVIGSLWLPTEKREALKGAIHQLRNAHKVGGEFKWGKVSPSRADFYLALVDLFFGQGDWLRFRCISVNRDRVNLMEYHEGDQELGFYKFYYQVLHHWISAGSAYRIFCDHKRNRDRTRLHVLQRCLAYKNLDAEVISVQAVKSEESVILQMTDFLTSAAASRLNDMVGSGTAKADIVLELERRLGHHIRATWPGERKFNVFEIQPGAGK